MFEPFYTTARALGNTGLGMHIVYNQVARVGGTVSVESAPDAGVCFTIALPKAFRSGAGGLLPDFDKAAGSAG